MGWLVLLIFLGLYGLPAIIAGRRNYPDRNGSSQSGQRELRNESRSLNQTRSHSRFRG